MVIKPGRCLLTKQLRLINKNQQWLSDITGMSKSQISDYANNRRLMSLATAYTIAAAIGCSTDDLYERIVLNSTE